MEIAYKFRLYPNKAQENLILQTFGSCRFVYNYYLALRKETYEQTGNTMNYYDCSKDMTGLKQQKEMQWLKEVDANALQSSLWDLDKAYKHFFRGVKNGSKHGFPKFKCKHNRKQAYKTKCTNNNIKVLQGAVQLPKLGKVKCRISQSVQGRVRSAAVTRSASGKYYVSLWCLLDQELPKLMKTGAVIGLDAGIKSFAVSSDGVEYPNPKYLRKSEKKMAWLQRKLSRKTKGSKNWNKARIQVARLHEHIANQRRDMQHKLSTKIVRQYDTICIEDLAPKNMMQNHAISKSIYDVSWGEFRRQLTYKTIWYGKQLVTIDRFYPSSQTCSECGARWNGVKNLKVRHWVCPECRAALDRDVNAAINILHEGMRLLA